MTFNIKKTIRQLATLFILLAIAMPSFSQQLTLPKNSDGYYLINSDNDYEIFRQIVAIGNPYANAVLTADITIRHAIGMGDEQFHYRGTFDGQGHYVTLAGENDSDAGASSGMFAYTKPGCVIRNLSLHGTLYTAEEYAGALVNDATGTIVENCVSEVSLLKTTSNDQYLGGFIGIARGKCIIESCGFTGMMLKNRHVCGFIGKNTQGLSMKSCFSASRGTFSDDYNGSATAFTENLEENDIFMNNYFIPLPGIANNIQGCINLGEAEDITSGHLCYLLNTTGKRGIVWYQGANSIYPFNPSNAKYARSTDYGNTIELTTECEHSYNYISKFCTHCGAIEPGETPEPLQNRGQITAESYLTIDDITYKYYQGSHFTVVGLDRPSTKFVHIPGSVNYAGTTRPVIGISADAFKDNTALEYCYIPKSVTEIGENAFSGCSNLKYVHIADCEASAEQDGLTVAITAFANCTSLETLYIGRNLKFNKENFAGQANTYLSPFSTDLHLHNIWFGSKVSYIGNVNNNETDQLTYLGGGNVQKVYIMGDDNSLNRYIDVKTYSDLARATDFYINRTLSGNCFSSTSGDKGGLLDGCVKATFGPYVTAINTDMFAGEVSHVKPLQTIDLTFAINLEAIGDRAFRFCENLDMELLYLTQTKVTTIGSQAFYDCKKIKDVLLGDKITEIKELAFGGCLSLSAIKIPSAVTSIGTQAFGGCNGLTDLRFEDSDTELEISSDQFLGTNISTCYIGRDLIVSGNAISADKSCVWKIGGKVNHLYKALFDKSTYQAMDFEYSDKPLYFDDYFNCGVTVVGYDRELKCLKDSKTALPFNDRAKATTQFINIGSNISRIYENVFQGYGYVDFLVIPSNITNIGSNAFDGCFNLQILSIMGGTSIQANAFKDCSKLEYLYLLNESISLAENAFDGCSRIKEISTVFDKNPAENSHPNAFTDETYQNTFLSTADDFQEIEFTSDPWKKFKYQGTMLQLQAVYDGTDDSREDISGEIPQYDRALSPCKLTKGQFSLIYLPFDVDSYIFGSDAEIYHLKNSGSSYTDETETVNDHLVDNVAFEKVNLDTQNTLYLGESYLVKPNHDIESMGGYFSFFDANSIAVDSYAKNRKSSDAGEALEMFGYRDKRNWAGFSSAIYFINDGVVKVINGDYISQPYDLYFANYDYETTPAAFNLLNGNTELLTSKTNLTFNKSLEGYSSFYAADYNYLAPDWCNVFVVTSALNGNITMEEITDRTITKGQAVLLKSSRELNGSDITEYLTYATHGSTESALYASNLLKGVTEETSANKLSPEHGFVYVLSCNAAGTNTGFYKLSGDRKMPVGKSYLDPSTINANLLAKACLFVCNDSATGITMPDADNANMQRIYNMMGRRLKAAGNKGIYIINNKKVLK